MRLEPIVADTPLFNDTLGLAQVGEPFQIQAFLSQFAIEAFYMSVLNRLARLDEEKPNPVLVSPRIKLMAGELRAIIRSG